MSAGKTALTAGAAGIAMLLAPGVPAIARSIPTKRSGSDLVAHGLPAVQRAARERPVPESPTHEPPPPQAPGGPPLSDEGMSAPGEPSSAPPSGGDALVENGLGSPMCREGAPGLSAAVKRDCELGGFIAAPDPLGDYALDVNINTSIGDVGNYLATATQNFTGFAWMVFVSVTEGLIVMLEWCYSLDKLTGELLGEIRVALHGARISMTEPWLALALSVAAVLVVYHGLVRRRVAQTLGEALTMLAMMAVGLWLIADPAGTIGVLDNWANQTGLSTLGAVASGSPQAPERTFAADMRRLFDAAVGSSWCYMEFGNVAWCGRGLDPGLRTAALKIAEKEQSESGCSALCAPGAGAKSTTLAASAALLHEAKSNGELFLALPANEPARNSTKKKWSLLDVLCGGEEDPADRCSGPTAAQAEMRSENGTETRLIGVILIWLGGLGMLALLGFLALHLLTAAIRTIVFLLLAPAAVLAPAFGESGRSLFRTWIARLLAAAVSKLIYSFFLGVVLLMVYLILKLTALGWWGRWLVMSAFWWGVFVKRGQIAGMVEGPRSGGQGGSSRLPGPPLKRVLDLPRTIGKAAGKIRNRLRTPAPDVQKRERVAKAGEEAARERADQQVSGTLDHDLAQDRERVGQAPQTEAQISLRRQDLDRVREQRTQALSQGHRRRAHKLGGRAKRIEGEITREESALTSARERVAQAEATQRLSGTPHTREQREERAGLLDAQAALPAGGRRNGEGVARDYASIASLAGYGAQEYRRLDPGRQREARLRIDRELATRAQLKAAAAELASRAERPPSRREQREAERELQQLYEQGMREEGFAPTPERSIPSNGRGDSQEGSNGRSPVMEDAFAVQRRRKRQLGREMLE